MFFPVFLGFLLDSGRASVGLGYNNIGLLCPNLMEFFCGGESWPGILIIVAVILSCILHNLSCILQKTP